MIYMIRDCINGKCFNVDRETFIKFIMEIKDDNTLTSYRREYKKDGRLWETTWATFAYDLIAISNKEESDNLIKEIEYEYIKYVAKEDKNFAVHIVIATIMAIGLFLAIMTIAACIKLGVIK